MYVCIYIHPLERIALHWWRPNLRRMACLRCMYVCMYIHPLERIAPHWSEAKFKAHGMPEVYVCMYLQSEAMHTTFGPLTLTYIHIHIHTHTSTHTHRLSAKPGTRPSDL
jgi:hypothetical protein